MLAGVEFDTPSKEVLRAYNTKLKSQVKNGAQLTGLSYHVWETVWNGFNDPEDWRSQTVHWDTRGLHPFLHMPKGIPGSLKSYYVGSCPSLSHTTAFCVSLDYSGPRQVSQDLTKYEITISSIRQKVWDTRGGGGNRCTTVFPHNYQDFHCLS